MRNVLARIGVRGRAGRARRRPAVVGLGLAVGLWAGAAAAQQAPLLGVRFAPASFPTELPSALGGKPNWVWHWFIEADEGWDALNGDDPAASHIAEAARRTDEFPARRALISYPAIPTGVAGVSRTSCAGGSHNGQYNKFGRAVATAGLDNAILRIGWEWDGGGTPISLRSDFSGTRIAEYRNCFRNVALNIRAGFRAARGSLAGAPLFDFNSTTNIGNTGVTPTNRLDQAYPGNDAVDIVSVEGYDNRPCANAADVDCRWNNVQRSLVRVRDFAANAARQKRFAIPEWAIWNDPNPPVRGFDNPEHVRRLCAFARTPGNDVFYYIYFNGNTTTTSYHNLTLPKNERSRQAFVAACGTGPA